MLTEPERMFPASAPQLKVLICEPTGIFKYKEQVGKQTMTGFKKHRG